MLIAQNLAVFILISQGISSFFLIISFQFDEASFKNIGVKGHPAIPGLVKSARLFSVTEKNLMMAMYFFSLVFVVFSYAGVVLLVIHLVRVFFL